MTAGIVKGGKLANNIIVGSPSGTLFFESCSFDDAQIFVDNDSIMQAIGGNSEFAGTVIPPKIYGPGQLDVSGATVSTDKGPDTVFFCTLTINGAASAYSNETDPGTKVVTVHLVTPITGATLAATAGASGFGGLAYNGASCIQQVIVTP
jgi:hypothetical protein